MNQFRFPGELTLSAAPTRTPLTLIEAKEHLRVEDSVTADDDRIMAYLRAATRAFEQTNRRTLYTTTWRYVLDKWPAEDYILLPRPPLASVTSVTYTDTDGNATVWSSADYVVETTRTPGRIHLAYNVSWPTASLRPASPIVILYVAGWSTTETIPVEYKQAILMLVGHWYENREAIATTGAVPKEMPFAFESLAMMDRV